MVTFLLYGGLGALLVPMPYVLIQIAGYSATSASAALMPIPIVIGFGMACAVVPLTNAVLNFVQPDHTGIASGLNSAVARTGGLVSTALLSFILVAQGAALQRLFEVAMLCAAAAALAAAMCAFVWLKPPAPAKNP